MNEKLRAYVEELFGNAPKTKQTVEIKEEILQNTIDRYNDLLKEGRTPEAAYNISVAGIGDVSHLIDSMVAPVASSGYTREEIAANEKKRTILLAIAVALYILCVIPPIICDELGAPDFVGATLLFVIVALATALIIYRNGIKLRYDKSDGTVVEDFKEWNRDTKERRFGYLGGKRRNLGAYPCGLLFGKLFDGRLVYKLADFHYRRRGYEYRQSDF